MTAAPRRQQRRGSARGVRFGDVRRADVQLARLREAQVVKLRAAGLSFAAIGAAIGTTAQGAHAAWVRCRSGGASVELRLEALALDACRVDALLRAVLPRAFAGRMSNIRAACGLIELRQTIVQGLVALRAEAGEARP